MRKGIATRNAGVAYGSWLIALLAVGFWPAASAESGPILTGDPKVGTMRVGETREIKFVVSNPTASPVEIESATSSCSCTDVEASQTTIAPGKEAIVTAKVHNDHYVTPDIRSQITVRTRGAENSELTALIEGHLEAPFFTEPEMLRFDSAAMQKQYRFALKSRGGGPVTVTEFSGPPWLEVTRQDGEFAVSVKGAIPYDLLQGEISLRTDDPRQPVVRVPVSLTQQRQVLAIEPKVMMLGELTPGAKGKPVKLITNGFTGEPKVTETLDGLDITITPGERPGEYLLTPVTTGTAADGPVRGVLHVTVRDGSRDQVMDIGVMGSVNSKKTD